MPRGLLRIYLGAAPGVGKTYAMLDEAHRRHSRGTDVVIGVVETHGRAATAAMVGDLEVIARAPLTYRGTQFDEMDLDAVLARNPQVVCVDELAHTNVPGSRNQKRWQDIEELLAAGITVLSTVNVQHLESLNDVVEKITGIRQIETVPDEFVRAADQVELVDLTPEALRRRMAHGNIYRSDKVEAALGNYFRVGNLTALRELALLWVADKVDEALQQYRKDHEIDEAWETRERVVVALTGGPEGDTLIRRASRIALRGGAELLAVHVVRPEGLSGVDPSALAQQRGLVESLGGSYHQVIGDRVAQTLIDFARAENATQLVLGASRRRPLTAAFTGAGIGATTVRLSGDIDVHIVTHGQIGQGRGLPKLSAGLTWRRRLAGALLAAATLPALTLVLTHLRTDLNLTSDLLGYLIVVIAVTLLGGIYPSLAAAVAASLLLNYYFTPPIHRFTIAHTDNIVALVAFLLVSVMVSSIVDIAARRTSQAARASAESRLLAAVAGNVLRGDTTITALLERLREALTMSSATWLERDSDASTKWCVVESVGSPPSRTPADADALARVGERRVLAVRGRSARPQERRVLGVFAAQIAAVRDQQLRAASSATSDDAQRGMDQARAAILSSFVADLRPKVLAAQEAIDTLIHPQHWLSDPQRDQLLDEASGNLDQLARDIENALERATVRALSVTTGSARIDESVAVALDAGDVAADVVRNAVPDNLPEITVDPEVLIQALTRITTIAARNATRDQPVRISAVQDGQFVELRIDIPAADTLTVSTPSSTDVDINETSAENEFGFAAQSVSAMGGQLIRSHIAGTPRLELRLPITPMADSNDDAGSSLP